MKKLPYVYRPGQEPKKRYYVGLDLGQVQDPTAVVILECTGFAPAVYEAVYLYRYPLLTPYQQIANDLRAMFNHVDLAKHPKELIVDATGVGRPVVEMIAAAGLDPISVTITGGYEPTRTDRGEWRVPKRDLVMATQLVFQSRRITVVPELEQAKLLRDELLNFRLKLTKAGNDTYEAWREGQHDDLVLAVAIALWYAEHQSVAGVTPGKGIAEHNSLEFIPIDQQPY